MALGNLGDDVCDKFRAELRKVWFNGASRKRIAGEELTRMIETPLPDLGDVPVEVSILVGEATYNFRAALDYLVGQLSRLNTPEWSASKPRRNQFPVETSAKGFAARRNSWLAGVSDIHVAMIEAYQPYAGCTWTSHLATLSNVDKHNDLIEVRQGLTMKFREAKGGKPPLVAFDNFVMVLNLGEHADLVDVLFGIADRVSELLEEFTPAFAFDVMERAERRKRFEELLKRPIKPRRGRKAR